ERAIPGPEAPGEAMRLLPPAMLERMLDPRQQPSSLANRRKRAIPGVRPDRDRGSRAAARDPRVQPLGPLAGPDLLRDLPGAGKVTQRLLVIEGPCVEHPAQEEADNHPLRMIDIPGDRDRGVDMALRVVDPAFTEIAGREGDERVRLSRAPANVATRLQAAFGIQAGGSRRRIGDAGPVEHGKVQPPARQRGRGPLEVAHLQESRGGPATRGPRLVNVPREIVGHPDMVERVRASPAVMRAFDDPQRFFMKRAPLGELHLVAGPIPDGSIVFTIAYAARSR